MPKLSDLIGGLKLIEKYVGPDKFCTSAELDILYAADCKMSDEDKAAMDAMGWHWDGNFDCWARFT